MRAKTQDYQQASRALKTAMENASQEERDYITGYLESARNYSSAHPLNNASQRDFETEVYRNALNYLNTGNKPLTGATASTTNIFGGRNHREVTGDAGYVWTAYDNKNKKNTQTTTTDGKTSGKTGGKGSYMLNATAGLGDSWGFDDDDLATKIGTYAQTLAQNLSKAIAKHNNGVYISNVEDPDSMQSDYDRLMELAQSTGSITNTNAKSILQGLAKIASKYNVTPSSFKNYFQNVLPGSDKISKNKKALAESGYELVADGGDYGEKLNQLINGKYHVAKKGNSYYLIADDYSGPVTTATGAYMNTDWRDPSKEGWGYAINADGSFVYGDMNPYYKDANSPWQKTLQNYITSADIANMWSGNTRKFNQFTSLSDSDLMNTFATDLHNKNVADVSRYFDGQDVVVTANGNNLDALRSKYGHLRLDDPNLTFYYKKKDGSFKKGTYQEALQDLGDIAMTTDKQGKGLQNFRSIDYNLDALTGPESATIRDTDVNRESETYNWFSPHRELKNGWNNEVINSDHSMTGQGNGIQNSIGKFVRLMLYAFAETPNLEQKDDKDSKELLQTLDKWLHDPKAKQDLIYLIYQEMSQQPQQFQDPRYRRAFQMLLESSRGSYAQTPSQDVIQQEKDGGILKAAMGAGLDASGNSIAADPKESIAAAMRNEVNRLTTKRNELTKRAEENGKTLKQQREIERNEWTTSDTLRATALATDVVGLIGAIAGVATGGVGSAVAIGSGFASMTQDAIADFTDEKVSTGQALKNLGINTGLAVGAAFGAKAPKIMKSAMRLIPKAMMAAGAAGVTFDPNVHNTIKRMSEGKEMKVEDWRNIILVLRTATGIGTVGATTHGAKKAAKKFDAEVAKEIKKQGINQTEITTENGGKKSIDSKAAKEVDDFLNHGKVDEAKAKMKEIGIEEADTYFEDIPGKRKWYAPWKRNESTGKRLRTDNLEGEISVADDVKADIYAKQRAKALRDFNKAKKDHKILNAMDQVSKFMFGKLGARQQNYALNAIQGRVGVTNDADLKKWITENQSAIQAHDVIKLDRNMGRAIHDASVTERTNLAKLRAANERWGKRFENQKTQETEALTKQQEAEVAMVDAMKKAGFNQTDQGTWQIDSSLKTNADAAATAATKAVSDLNLANLRVKQITNNIPPKDLAKYRTLKTTERAAQTAADKALAAEQKFLKAHPTYQQPSGPGEPLKANAAAKADPAYKTLLKDVKATQKNLKTAQTAVRGLITTKKGAVKKAFRELDTYETAQRDAQKTFKKTQAEAHATKKAYQDKLAELAAQTNHYRNQGVNVQSTEASRQKAIADLEAQHKTAETTHKERYDKKRDQRMEEWRRVNNKALMDQSQDIGKLRKQIKMKDGAGNDVTIKTGTTVKSYQHYANEGVVTRAYEQNHPDAIPLSKEQVSKLVNSTNRERVRGGFYDAASDELVIYKQGGKYSHLRK